MGISSLAVAALLLLVGCSDSGGCVILRVVDHKTNAALAGAKIEVEFMEQSWQGGTTVTAKELLPTDHNGQAMVSVRTAGYTFRLTHPQYPEYRIRFASGRRAHILRVVEREYEGGVLKNFWQIAEDNLAFDYAAAEDVEVDEMTGNLWVRLTREEPAGATVTPTSR